MIKELFYKMLDVFFKPKSPSEMMNEHCSLLYKKEDFFKGLEQGKEDIKKRSK